MSNTINGITFEKMMLNALNNIYVHEKEINDMNVFPVADGDTGTNMRLTLENGLKHASTDKHLGNYLKSLSTGMLLGARGNSGVILSQIFKGMYQTLKSDSIVNPGEFRNAFINGYITAYKAVLNPVEGTILTVCRLGIENIRHLIKGGISLVDTFKLYVNELNKALELTPSLLPTLKEANVLDSGAKGYIIIIEGMYQYLLGRIIDRDSADILEDKQNTEVISNNEKGYLVDISVKLNNNNFDFVEFEEKFKDLSDSINIKINDNILSIKLHTENPTPILKEVRGYGEVISFNLENSKMKNTSIDEKPLSFKAITYIACVSGSGVKELYKEMGVDIFLTMNPSSQDFLDAFKRANAEHIVILPNDKNIFETARQAVKISLLKNVTILSTKNVLEGYYRLAMDVPDASIDNRLDYIKEEVVVECLSVSKAIKDYSNDILVVKTGEYVAYKDEEILSSNSNILACLSDALNNLKDIENKGSAFILLGNNVSDNMEDELNEFFEANYSNLELTILEGKQSKEDIIIGLL